MRVCLSKEQIDYLAKIGIGQKELDLKLDSKMEKSSQTSAVKKKLPHPMCLILHFLSLL